MSGILIGGSAHQTWNGSDLRELIAIATDLTGAFRLPPAFIQPKRRRKGYRAGPPKKALGAHDVRRIRV